MGTTLTGTTPQDTYDSLIKVTNNGPLSSTARYLSDGLGNDSVLALSTTSVGIGTTTPSTKLQVNGGNLTVSGVSYPSLILDSDASAINFSVYSASSNDYIGISNGTSDLAVFKTSGNVGIGTSSPSQRLSVENSASTNPTLVSLTGSFGTGRGASISLANDDLGAEGAALKFTTNVANPYGGYVFSTQGGERVRILGSGGITFNGDTAAANALDDYEEGTWTMGITFGGASVGVTTLYNSGTYTKVGRQVTVNGLLQLTSKGSSTGAAKITGLPFTVGGVTSYYSASALRFKNIAFVDQYQGMCDPTTTTVILEETTNVGATTTITDVEFANNSEIIISLTYFV